MDIPSIDISRVVAAQQAIKAARTAKRHAWEAADAELEADETKVRVLLLELLQRSGANSIATDYGTVYKSEKIKPSVPDWSAFYDWVMEDKARFEAIEKRVKSTFVKEYMDEHDGGLPPGVSVHREYEVNVRRPTAPKD